MLSSDPVRAERMVTLLHINLGDVEEVWGRHLSRGHTTSKKGCVIEGREEGGGGGGGRGGNQWA